MAKQNRTTLKTYFEDGDTPSSAEFGELIDSQLNLADTGDQEVAGNVKVLGTVSASVVGASTFQFKGLTFEETVVSENQITGSNVFGSQSSAFSANGVTSHSFFGPIYQSSSGAHSASYFLTPVIVGTTETSLSESGLHIYKANDIASSINHLSHSAFAALILSSSDKHLAFDSNEMHQYGSDLKITAQGNAGDEGNILFRSSVSPTETPSPSLYISSSGAIGIGNSTPTGSLVVEGNISASGDILGISNISSSGNIRTTGNISASGEGLGGHNFGGNITSSGTISASGAIYASSFVGSANFTGFQLNDNDKLTLGNGQDLRLHHDGTDSFIHNIVGNLTISLDTVGNDKDIIFKVDDDEYIRLDSDTDTTEFSKKINIGATGGSSGVDAFFYGNTSGRHMQWDASEDALTFKDNTKLKMGSGDDLSIYHDGTDSYLYNTTGDIVIQNHAQAKDIIFKNYSNTEVLRLKSALVNFSKKITDSSDVPIIARNIVVDNQSGNGPEISDSGANIYENFRTTGVGNVQLQCTITTKTINPLFLVSANCAVGAKTEHQSFVAQIILSKGSDSFTTAKFANDSTEATDIACGTTGDDHNKTLCGLPIPNTLVQYTDTSIVAGDEVKVRIQIKCTESNHGYFMNRTENDDFTPHSFLTIEEIPQANG